MPSPNIIQSVLQRGLGIKWLSGLQQKECEPKKELDLLLYEKKQGLYSNASRLHIMLAAAC